MLHDWENHCTFQENLILKLQNQLKTQRSRLVGLDSAISKLYLLNLDNLLPVVKSLFSGTGRPAKNQQGIIRSLVLMFDQRKHSITNWSVLVAHDPLLFDICGFNSDKAPSVASYYDFLVRVWLSSHDKHIESKKRVKSFTSKPRKKLKAGQKLPPKHPGTVKRLVKKATEGKLPDFRPERILQDFLARCIVDTSAKMGLLGDVSALSIAMDGSCYNSGASHYGVKVCDCKSKGIYNCKCSRRFSDPDARWGWDSYHEQHFYGKHTGFSFMRLLSSAA